MNYFNEKCVFAGSFDPVTLGHMHVIGTCAMMFGSVIVAIGVNDAKKYTYSLDQRLEMLKKACSKYSSVTVVAFDGMLADFMRENNAVYYVRGIRNKTDEEYEEKCFKVTSKLNPDIQIMFVQCPKALVNTSSTRVRDELKKGKRVDNLVPYEIIPLLEEYSK
ncbi:MAG: pantetheine-phosphate adenylyltransferase [Clostridia bacterium]|nr:pantetheine-phosphate adenylyltransferase [Clostridia bacterium]